MEYKADDPVRLKEDGRAIIVIDQRLLPGKTEYLEIRHIDEMVDAIKSLAVRGAPCIGVFAGYSMALLASDINKDRESFMADMKSHGALLTASRPTAVNLSWAVNRQLSVIEAMKDAPLGDIAQKLMEEAVRIHEEDISMCLRIAESGLSLLKDGNGILTHCNAGALATTRYGTGLGPLLLGAQKGLKFKVYSDETRPLLQGMRLTAYELIRAGVDETVICDNMAGLLMKQKKIDAVMVGCDRVAANGDTANKIGTSSLAVLAKYYGIPFYVLGPFSSIDISCKTGDDIVIEERDQKEISSLYFERDFTIEGVKYYNPAFDVTDNALITAIVTDRGILYPPYTESIKNAI